MAENRLLTLVKQNEDLEELLTREKDSELLYHFSKMRRNIIEWYDFSPNSKILEVGGGCGTITQFLCERGHCVVSIEEDEAYASVNSYRNRTSKCVEVTAKKIYQFQDGEFDYVLLIGSLCCAKKYTEETTESDAYCNLLTEAKRVLKPDGVLLVAVPNRFGVKYLAGMEDELTSKRFSGIENYKEHSKVKAFSKSKLVEMLNRTGFEKQSFYYPVPDYLFATEIFSDDYLPKEGDFQEKSPNYFAEQIVLFDEAAAVNAMCKENVFTQFANSYLVVCQ